MATTDDRGYHKNLHRVVLFGKWGMWETPLEGSEQDEAAGMLRPWSSGLSPAVWVCPELGVCFVPLCSTVTGSLASLEGSLCITDVRLYPQFIIFLRLGGSESAFDMKCRLLLRNGVLSSLDALARFPLELITFITILILLLFLLHHSWFCLFSSWFKEQPCTTSLASCMVGPWSTTAVSSVALAITWKLCFAWPRLWNTH